MRFINFNRQRAAPKSRIFVELSPGYKPKTAATEIQREFKNRIGITAIVLPVAIGELPRSEKKSTRIFDNRY